ncbi:MAG: hypothetical protein JNM44_02435 [Chitinophagaceae bacterium]|nr:hypothetical protein [Chitinophagaceae bacterium]
MSNEALKYQLLFDSKLHELRRDINALLDNFMNWVVSELPDSGVNEQGSHVANFEPYGKRHEQVYYILYKYGQATFTSIVSKFEMYGNAKNTNADVAVRFGLTKLLKMGVIEKIEIKGEKLQYIIKTKSTP